LTIAGAAAWKNEEHDPLGALFARFQWAQLAARVVPGGIAAGRSVPSSSCCCFFYKRHAVAATHKGLTTQPTQTTQ
jgi:hypothetical protein